MKIASFKAITLAVIFSTLLSSGCAPKNWDTEEEGAFDPLEGFNRHIYKMNKGLDWLILKPAARGYQHFPPFMKTGIENVINNLDDPSNAVNYTLQRNGSDATRSVGRFALNTVFGIGGIFDTAGYLGLKYQNTDLGKTLRSYGLSDTMYIVLPVVGPTTVGDGIGRSGDSAMDVFTYVNDDGAVVASYAVRGVQARAALLETTDTIEEAALDEYSFVRDAYEDKRRANLPENLWFE